MWADLPPMTRATFVVKSGARDDAEGHRIASTLDLAGVCDRIKAPALYVTGAKDRLIPWRQTERQAAETPDGTSPSTSRTATTACPTSVRRPAR